ncbi:Heat shock 70 kDa protein 18 [Phytophthora nicotianae]|uniref:Heat shock 70 kDa protein 18 n=1 Tax=Phytophthora nicotianae TaxID=4792 RepID=A0A0W8DWC0_PHYNI|nr:Heat shock 70 kDa protein 18 [Phytophthora nicotianae]
MFSDKVMKKDATYFLFTTKESDDDKVLIERINNETSVAALAYGLDTNAGTDGKACNVQIFVLGGGTVDVSILSIRVRHLEVKSTGGDSAEDSDNNMVQHLLTEFERKIRNLDPSGSARASVVTACESAKRMLLTTTSASVEVTSLFEGVEFSSTVVTRAKFESLNEELFMRCEVTVFKVLEDAKMKPEDWCGSEVLHVFPHAVHAVPRQGAVQVSQPGRGRRHPGWHQQRRHQLLLVDVTPLSQGIETVGKFMSVLIKRKTHVSVTVGNY